MGSFWGHLDEGIFFTLLATWWIFHACYQYIESQWSGKQLKLRLSYSIRCKKDIPLEIIFKFIFPFGGFLAEVIDGGFTMIDKDGNFRMMVNAQHMTIYGIFILHSVFDLLTWAGVPMIPGFAHASVALSFVCDNDRDAGLPEEALNYLLRENHVTVVHAMSSTVTMFSLSFPFKYGVAFYYHSQMHGKEPLETIVHVIPIAVMVITGLAFLLEWTWSRGPRTTVWTTITRAYGVLTLGTWFSHVGFILYEHNSFPGRASSGLDRSDIRNVQYARACFGLHLLANMIYILVCYFITYLIVCLRQKLYIGMMHTEHEDDILPLKKKPYRDDGES